MKYRLSKVIMHNFKLFSHVSVELKGQAVTVLDGPNGYGKTTTFDAIEYILTGTVERIENSTNVSGNMSYSEDCLMKDPSDKSGTYVEGHFIAGNKELMIRRRIENGEGRGKNNPRQIKGRTKTDIELDGKIVVEGEECERANKRVAELLDEQVIKFYNRYFYISQEDRLAFLKKNDTERMKEIEKQFGIEKEEEMFKKLGSARKKFSSFEKVLEEDIKNKNEEIKKITIPKESEEKGKVVAYKKLLDNDIDIIWDREFPQIIDMRKLSDMQQEVEGVSAFSRDFSIFCKEKKNIWINQRRQNKAELKSLLFLHAHEEKKEDFFQQMREYQTIQKMIQPLQEKTPLYAKVSYDKIAEILGFDVDLVQISEILKNVNAYQRKLKQEESVRNELLRLRTELVATRKKWIEFGIKEIEEEKCPLCGHTWDNPEQLEESIKALTFVLENNKGDNQKLLDEEIDKLKKIYIEQYQDNVEGYLKKHAYLDNEICNEVYQLGEAFRAKYRSFARDCKKYQIALEEWALDENTIDDADEVVDNFIKECLEKNLTEIPQEYEEREIKYDYVSIFKRIYNEEGKKVKKLSQDEIKKKKEYLEQQFYLSQGKKKAKLNKELEEYEKCKEYIHQICEKLGEIIDVAKDKLRKYNGDMVKDLRLPFYLYTGRILQNYPGGLGVKLKITGDDKIGFKASERDEHDVFYTFSSGQLSAVAIALTLTLNKVYAEDKFNCIMIDDPIQTMDELNISSFVELMRNDFSESQFIISTHEDDFSDYVRYKYQKYHLSNWYVTVRDLER